MTLLFWPSEKNKKRIFFLLLFFLEVPLLAQPFDVLLQNNEQDQVFYYWILKDNTRLQAKNMTQKLSHSRIGRQVLIPQESRTISLTSNELLVGVFVPWKEELTFLSKVQGGILLFEEKNQVVFLDVHLFYQLDKTKKFSATLQDLDIPAPQFILDGQFHDWEKIPFLVEFSSDFRPIFKGIRNQQLVANSFPSTLRIPTLIKIYAAQFDHGLWFYFQLNSFLSVDLWSLNLRYRTKENIIRLIEIPFGRGLKEVVFWDSPQSRGKKIGQSRTMGLGIEVWIPLSRLNLKENQELQEKVLDLSQVVEFNETLWDLYYTSFVLRELP